MRGPSGFDAVAEDYDDAFSRSILGTLMRRAVWRRLDQRFSAGDRVLELNCGTCEDAIHLGAGVSVCWPRTVPRPCWPSRAGRSTRRVFGGPSS